MFYRVMQEPIQDSIFKSWADISAKKSVLTPENQNVMKHPFN